MASTHASATPAQEPLLQRFEQALASNDSATEALAQWCAARGIAAAPVIRAVVVKDRPLDGASLVADAETRALLSVGPDEPLGYRHVRLMCGEHVLSDARNWYVPARLTPAMNQALTTGERPFGAVIAPLHFTRERLDSRHGPGTGCPARTILTNRAVIRAHDGGALALVVECYQPAVLR